MALNTSRRVMLGLLGAAQIVVGVALLPVALFFGFASMIIVPLLLIWMVVLAVRLQRPTPRLRVHLRRTHMAVLPIAALFILYGSYALTMAQRSAETGGGLMGAFGLIPIVSGLVAGCLSGISLWICGSAGFAVEDAGQ